MFSRRNLIILAVLALAAAGGALYWRQRQAADAAAARASLRQETLQQGAILSTVSATGSVAPEAQVSLFFSTAQPLPVADVNAELGQAVRRGDLLARLDTTDLELAVTQAEQSLRAAQLGVDALLAPPRPEDVAMAEASLRLARAQVYAASLGRSPEEVQIAYFNLQLARNALDQTHRTMDTLVAQGLFAQKQALQGQEEQQIEAARIADLRYQAAQASPSYGPVASALAAVEQAQVTLDRLQGGPKADDLKIARLRVEQAGAALALARNNLADARIVAPFDGVVAAVNIRYGELAVGALPAVVLVDGSRFYLEVLVDEVDVPRVEPGQAVTVTLDALPDALVAGRVEKIAPTATINQGVVSYLVRLTLEPGGAALRAGMTATADIVVAEVRDVVLAPNWAIRRDRDTGQAFVDVLRGGQIETVQVELGLRNDTFSEVKRGLAAGDVVVTQTQREQFSLFGGE